MTNKELKKLVCSTIDNNAEKLIDFAKKLDECPELGFKENKTSELVANFFEELNLHYKKNLAITGVKAKLKENCEGPNIAILGELDAVLCPTSSKADPLTGAAHACGHNLQLTAMIGAALGLKLSNISDTLHGNVTFMGVPAEEFIEIEYREKLHKEGKIHFFGGKQELIYLGEFDDVDISMMMHSDKNTPETKVSVGDTSNGFMAKTIQYLGKTAHAAEAPHEGINALNAAMIGLMGINALRETFIDEDHVRVHPIITKGGDTVNSVPCDVRLETYVRAKSMKSIENTHTKVDNSLKAGGYAVGAETIIKTIPGYLPLNCAKDLNNLFVDNTLKLIPKEQVINAGHFGASTDMGDLSHIIPTIHPFIGGVTGALHTEDFHAVDYYSACILPAKIFAMTVIDLLSNNAGKAKEIKANFKPLLTKEEYITMMENYFS
ncbi:amidohydrolase [Clostridium ganghwense]|uniref:Peptidase M20 domain-containing protein 2 n=1 Tax=Clostridium ganghwense TaxID=312089 RepID=A0ABT4CLG4_9CLOT|nr:amidohydrolase [Clostridium ganghwense]MCY6369768.1 amidohydrolase [Clostridium ganghwense]